MRGLSSPMRRDAMSMLPRMTVSMLLKSCAMPPDSRPTASIFCAWRSACSVASRRLTSCCSRSVRRSAMKPRLTSVSVAGRPKIRWLAMASIQARMMAACSTPTVT